MRPLGDCNPIVLLVHVTAVTAVAMFSMNPVLLGLAWLGSLLWYLRQEENGLRFHLFSISMIIMSILVNPIISHNGMTVLFVINDLPVTLESIAYGAGAGVMLSCVLYWFASFSRLMTSDKLLYLFGSLSPKLALIMSMAIRYVPLFAQQTHRVAQAQKAMGLAKEDTIPDRIKGGGRILSVMVTWALENGIITADSMTARGYGIGRRTFFSLYRFRKSDAVQLLLALALVGVTAAGIATDTVYTAYYPALGKIPLEPKALICYGTYALLSFLPVMLEIKEEWMWRSLQSKV